MSVIQLHTIMSTAKEREPSQAHYYYYYYYYNTQREPKKRNPSYAEKIDQGGTRTHNLWIRSPTRYPLRHMTGSIWFLTTSIRHTPFVVGWTIFKWDVTPRTNAFIRFYAMNSRISIIERQRKSGIVQDLPLNSFRSTRSITFLIVLYCTCVYP